MRAELNIQAARAAAWRLPVAAFVLALLAGLVSLLVSDAWRVGFSGADEPAHFLNGYFISAYVREAFGTNPMAFATEYYLHYPKISIGHWPPAYYALLSPFFLALPPTPGTAFAINLVIASLAPVLAGVVAARLTRPAVGLIVALICAMTPVALEGQAFFMLDQPLAGVTMAATLLWASYVDRPKPWKILSFAVVAAIAVLIKGNGWLLLFVPPIHLALTGRWSVLRSPWPWAAALLSALLVGPWYWLTAGISADGFNYQPGLAYAALALSFNLTAIAGNLTLAGLLLGSFGLWRRWRLREEQPGLWNLAAGCSSLVLASLALQSLVPVDLDARYVAPALPPLIVLAFCGAWDALRDRWRPAALAAAALVLAVPGVVHLVQREPKIGFRLDEAADFISRPKSAWVIDGSSGAEGAFIAAAAVRDPRLQNYTIRSSKLLAESNFMGSEYRLLTNDPAAVQASLRGLGVEGIVLARVSGEAALPHSALLRKALNAQGSSWRLVARLPHLNRPGVTEIYRSAAPVQMQEPKIRALGLPEKAEALAASDR